MGSKLDLADRETSGLVVWDTQDCAPSKAHILYQDLLRSSDLPWTATRFDGTGFKARIESVSIGQGVISRHRAVPIELLRTKSDIAHSSKEYFGACYVLSGSIAFEQDDYIMLAHKGDFCIFDNALPAKFATFASTSSSPASLSFVFPKDRFAQVANPEIYFSNQHYPREKLFSPLASILSHLSNRLIYSSYEELRALLAATIDLVPLAAGYYAGGAVAPLGKSPGISTPLREILSFIEDNLSKPKLSAADAAKEVGVSERYVHKLLASSGMRFSACVTAKRLDRVYADLVSPNRRRMPISTVAYNWGFNDISSFNRAFRNRFGCSPGTLRF